MSGDSAMQVDDDRLQVLKSAPNGANTRPGVNGNGLPNHKDDDSSMSEDDDLPLSQTTRKSESISTPPRNLKRKKPVYAESSSDEDTPLASSPAKQTASAAVAMPGAARTTTVPAPTANGHSVHKQSIKAEAADSDFNDDAPKPRKTNGKTTKPPKKKVKEESDNFDASSDEEKPPVTKKPAASRKRKVKAESDASSADEKPPTKKPAPKPRGKKKEEEDASGSDTPKPKKRASKTKKEETNGSPSKGKGRKKEKQDEEQEEVFRWWEADPNGDGSVKWQTLEHNGVIFPPPYEPLPKHVKMKYNGKEVDLPPAAEEVAGFYAAMLETDHAQDATFNKNFFEDWKAVMKQHPPLDGTKITSFALCDFRPMFEYFEAEKAKKKAMSAQEKKDAKKAKEDMEAKYTTCLLDGRKEKVGNFRVEPPGLFRGRGDHPKKGALKLRVRPEDITINIGENAAIPIPNMPGKWKAVTHDNTVTWLANWTENVNGNHKYVFLAAGSSLKGQSDMIKFEKARELKNHVDRIRQNYNRDLRSKVMADRQRATAMYFIDKLALRAGNEKGEDEADTVGCCSLRCEHVTLEMPDFIIFDFLGKDSIRYYNRIQVEPQVFKNIRIFKDNKDDDDNLFDRVTTSSLNKHLTSEMKGLTAKVFRTYNASITFQRLLDEETLIGATLQEKLNAYNKANRMVAILCNHQRSVPKTHDQSMEKMRHKHRCLKYERMKLRHALFNIDSKYKKQKKYIDDESDIDDDWIVSHEEDLKAKEIEKAEKKFAKDNEKLVEEGKKPQKDSVLQERIEAIEEDFDRLAQERGTKKATLKRERPVEKIEEAIDKLTDKAKAFKLQIDDRDAGKEVALGTSKINYLDPRITAAWCQIHDVPIEKMFSKTLVTKFPWAMEVEQDWKF
ncbi:DNA topoisomerase 1 [Hypsizygus marmoreus]|uniref:DNA topoisomerase I n=1 Tax=Hypsizygus marmoreus TaxID=39966 RepID=A0A369JZ76_HYPMA|nr:DNA topoisomerase 1 [Hypsizygus marmoreus]